MLSHVISSSNAISTVFSILVVGKFCNGWGGVLDGTTVFHSDVYGEYVLICEKEYTIRQIQQSHTTISCHLVELDCLYIRRELSARANA